ncbi:MAG: HD domain-containing protein [Planctomycetota bacterium]|nr:HD domain-containing protein [Planctomycetota bacterium]
METSRFRAVHQRLERLIEIAAAMNAEQDLSSLLELIVNSAVELTDSDAGSLYIREGDKLYFRIALNHTLSRRDKTELTRSFGKSVSVPIGEQSLAGYVALNGKPLNIPDAYSIHGKSYSHNEKFDRESNYECHSMLLWPMFDHLGKNVGVVQIINRNYDPEQKTWSAFSADDEQMIRSLSSLAGTAITRSRLIHQLSSSYRTIMTRIARAVEMKEADPDTHVHNVRLAKYAREIGEEMELDSDFVSHLHDAAPMHDIGKQCVPDAVLFKPGKLSDDEFDTVKRHTLYGSEIFEGLSEPIAEMAHNIARSHHERYDGTGYPDGVAGEDISLEARIIAVADVFDALSSKRVYNGPFPLEKCFSIIEKDIGKHFDPEVANAFLRRRGRIVSLRDAFENIKRSDSIPPLEELLAMDYHQLIALGQG